MATAGSLAIRNAQAVERLAALAKQSGTPLVIPTQSRDPQHLRAAQLEALAAWAESAIGGTQDATITDETFGAELARRMDEHGVTLNSTKADIVAFLEVYLGDAG